MAVFAYVKEKVHVVKKNTKEGLETQCDNFIFNIIQFFDATGGKSTKIYFNQHYKG